MLTFHQCRTHIVHQCRKQIESWRSYQQNIFNPRLVLMPITFFTKTFWRWHMQTPHFIPLYTGFLTSLQTKCWYMHAAWSSNSRPEEDKMNGNRCEIISLFSHLLRNVSWLPTRGATHSKRFLRLFYVAHKTHGE